MLRDHDKIHCDDAGEIKTLTIQRIKEHPVNIDDIKDIVMRAWSHVLNTKVGSFMVGKDIFPRPQVIGFLLHDLIAMEFQVKFPGEWRADSKKKDKDVVCIENDKYSIEIKTSSSKGQIFGNRSYAKETTSPELKSKESYYLTVNYDKFRPEMDSSVNLMRFGYLEKSDWIAQEKETGQQARLKKEAYENKLIIIYKREVKNN